MKFCAMNFGPTVLIIFVNCLVYQGDMIRMKRVGQEGEGLGEFKLPVGLHYMSSTNQVLVCDSENKRIQVFNPEEF